MTTEQEKAARYDLRQRGLELKKHLATLKGQRDRFTDAWQELSGALRNLDSNIFKISDGQIIAACPRPSERLLPGHMPTMDKIAAVPVGYFDVEALTELLTDLEKTKQSLADVSQQCRDMGDPL